MTAVENPARSVRLDPHADANLVRFALLDEVLHRDVGAVEHDAGVDVRQLHRLALAGDVDHVARQFEVHRPRLPAAPLEHATSTSAARAAGVATDGRRREWRRAARLMR